MARPLCFVLMPFGSKSDLQGRTINFDVVYEALIGPAVEAAELEPIRADKELAGGIIHKAMFERLILCPFAVADLTLANANVFYELGVRHAVRPHSTVSLFAEGTRLPFDVRMLRCVPYRLSAQGTPDELEQSQTAVTRMLQAARQDATDDSPVFQLIEDIPWRTQADRLEHEKTDSFRDRARYSEERKRELARARQMGLDEIKRVEDQIRAEAGSIENAEAGVVVDAFLSYRSVKAWDEMIRLADQMAPPMHRVVMVQEQLALALNRRAGELARQGKVQDSRAMRDRAVQVLKELIAARGPSSETNGILGRVCKDCWEEARNAGIEAAARGWLEKAIGTYLAGFEADWRDAYPGINAVTLMEIRDPPDERRKQLVPVVTYAVERRIASKQPDYWDYATRLELAVLANDRERAEAALGDAMAHQRERWEPETTARNLRLIREAREARGEAVDWLVPIIEQLEKASGG